MKLRISSRDPSRSFASRVHRRVALGATAIVLVLGAVAPSASANENFLSGTLSITYAGCCNDYRVTVSGHAHMTQSDAQRFLNTPGNEARFMLWGADSGWNGDDDQLTGDFYISSYWTASDGLYFSRTILVDGDTLDEDNGEDDVYAKIKLLDIRTGQQHQANTNQIHRYF